MTEEERTKKLLRSVMGEIEADLTANNNQPIKLTHSLMQFCISFFNDNYRDNNDENNNTLWLTEEERTKILINKVMVLVAMDLITNDSQPIKMTRKLMEFCYRFFKSNYADSTHNIFLTGDDAE